MPPVCAHAIAPTWHHDDSGIIVWTDRLCADCARNFAIHFWLMFGNQRWN